MKKVIAGKIKPQLRLDGYYNVLNKYGTQHDSTEYYQWATGAAVTDAELADLYAGNGLFSTIIDAPADDATKNGIDLGIKDKDLQKRLDDHLQTIHYQSKLAKALKWARLFGGSAVVMLVDDGRLLQDPLNWRDVHGVAELLVYGRNEVFPLWINGYENNPDDENYRKGGTGIPEFYQVNSVYGSYVVHSSRCLIFHNGEIPEGSTMANLYRTWGIPEYMRIREELRNASIGPGYSIRLLERLSMVTYKMKNLANVLSTADGDDTVLQRMLDAANARADAAEDDTKPTEDEDDNPDDSNSQLNHDSASAIAAQVSQRVELCRLGDKLHLDGMESMPVMQAKKKVVHAVIPGMRLDGKSSAYINAAFDIAKGKINGRKTVADQRRQVFNADSANAAVRNVGKKNDPDAARDRMIQRHAGEKED